MPPKKASNSTTQTGDDILAVAASAPGGSGTIEGKGKEKETPKKDKDELAIEDLTMPRTMVQRLAKGVLPSNTQIQKDAVTALSKGATVFINYISSHAQTHASNSSRKTIGPNDVFAALRDTEFDFLIPRLEAELGKYIEIQTGKRNEYRKKVRESAGARKSEGGEGEGGGAGDKGKTEEARSAKRAKGEGGEIIEGDPMEDFDMDEGGQEDEEVAEDDIEEDEDEENSDESSSEPDPSQSDPLEAPRESAAPGWLSGDDSDE